MIGRRRILAGLMIAFCCVGCACAETIPFDYWYGRIEGADRMALEFRNGRSDHSTYLLSLGIGSRGKYEIFHPNRYSYIPNGNSDKINSTNDGLSLTVKTPFHSRYEFTLLRHLNDKYDYVSNGYNGVSDVNEFSFSHRFQIWSGDSLAFDPKVAAYVLFNGPWYSAKNFYVTIDNLILRNDNNRSFNIYRVEPSRALADTGRTDGLQQQTDITGSAKIGLGSGWQADIYTLSNKRKGAGTTRRRYEWIYPEANYIDTVNSQVSNYYRFINKSCGIQVTRLLRPTLWSSLHYQYSHESDDNESLSHYDYLGRLFGRIDHRMDQGHTSANAHELVGSLMWLSRNQSIERQMLLDNFAGYYGLELEQGTLVIDSRFRWYERKSDYQFIGMDGTENEVVVDYRAVQRWRGLFLATALGYYLRPNFSVGASLQIERMIREGQESFGPDYPNEQLTTLRCWLEYRSYRWQADHRREISWDNVPAIEYLLGTMLRKGDLQLRLTATPPGLENTSNEDSGQLWNLQFGSLNHDWEVKLEGALGLPHNFEIGSTISYQYHRTYSYPSDWSARITDENLQSTIEWQPTKFARLSCSYEYTYRRIDSDGTVIFVPDGGMDWTLSTKVDFVW